MHSFMVTIIQLLSLTLFTARRINALAIGDVYRGAIPSEYDAPGLENISVRTVAVGHSTYFLVAAILGSIIGGVGLLLCTLFCIKYLRTRFPCNRIVSRRTRRLCRDESFCSRPTAPTPKPPTPKPPMLQLNKITPPSNEDIIGLYLTDDWSPTPGSPDSPRSFNFTTVQYVPHMNYCRPSSIDSPRNDHFIFSSYSDSSTVVSLQMPQPSSPKRETFSQPLVRSKFPRAYQLHDPGFLPPLH